MEKVNKVLVKKSRKGYSIILPDIEDKELCLFATFDGILEYIFNDLSPEETQRMCNFMGERLAYYCEVNTEEMKKQLYVHTQKHYKEDSLLI